MDLIAIVGPTASGKTDFAIQTATQIGAEIISADSMQVYKYMDIGTAKPTLEERRNILHHLIDIIEPSEEFNVVQFKKLALEKIEDIKSRRKIPILVGGTGLYIDSVIKNIEFHPNGKDENIRTNLKEIANRYGSEYLHELLKKKDNHAAEKIHPNDIRRIIRALEISDEKPKEQTLSPYKTLIIGLNVERNILYDKINKRVDSMLQKGLIDEVKFLLSKNMSQTAMQALGYKEIISYLNKECTLEFAVDLIKQSSRRYAKRQLTWFRRNHDIKWIDVNEGTNIKDFLP